MTHTRSGKAGDKHQLDDSASSGSPPAKVQKKENQSSNGDEEKKQTTIEESLNGSVSYVIQLCHGLLQLANLNFAGR